MGLEEITKKEFGEEPQKGINLLLQLYNKGLGEIPWEIFNSASFALINSKIFVSSQKYRSEVVKNYIRGRINKAEQKGRIKTSKAVYLYSHLDKEEISPYLLDFFMQTVGLNAIGSLTIGPYFVYLPFLSGEISVMDSFIRAQLLGSITRTAWTFGKISYECLKKENVRDRISFKEKIKSAFEKRSVALVIGAMPSFIVPIGPFGYLIQMIHSEYKKDKELGDFLLDDSLYGIEKKIPIMERVRKWIINKIYKDSLHIDSYGTNRNNWNKGIG